MRLFSQGDILWCRHLPDLARPERKTLAVVLAVHTTEKIGSETIYTCAPLCDKSHRQPGDYPVQLPSGYHGTIRLGDFFVAGESLFDRSGFSLAPVHKLNPEELASLRMKIDALLEPNPNLLGIVVRTSSPSHNGHPGKPNRPHVLVCEIGTISGRWWAVPVGSRPSQEGLGSEIKDLDFCGLVRLRGQKSYTRLAWSTSIPERSRLVTKPVSRLSDRDERKLFDQCKSFAQMLVSGKVTSLLE